MADSLAAAFAAIEGPELDAIVGYSVTPRRHAPVDEEARAAFDGFEDRHHRRIARMLAARFHCDQGDGEDAVQDTLLYLLVRRPAIFRVDPKKWLGLLYYLSRFRLIEIRASRGRVQSIEGLIETAGDAPFVGARPCVSHSRKAEEESRYVRPPRAGESWGRTQILGALQRFRDFHGHPPRTSECRAIHELPSSTTINRHFGSFANALLEAGMVPDTYGRRHRRWSPVEAARTCLSFRWRNGYWPDWVDVERNPGELPGTRVMIRLFGGTRSGEVQQGAEAILAAA